MVTRKIAEKVRKASSKFPIVGVVGPRQSGKTTLVKNVFSDYKYVSLEDPDVRHFATDDPRGFLATYKDKVILDEIQRVPDLFSYLQSVVDESGKKGQYVLTGSQHFLLMQNISQTLAGRISLFTLLPYDFEESLQIKGKSEPIENHIFRGGYPRVVSQNMLPRDWYSEYVQTYVERDVRQLKNVSDLAVFQRFVKLCAGRIGQLLNLSSLAQDAGISHNTARDWLSVLQTSFLTTLVNPYFVNISKRLVKSPKIYFVDTGLACYLLDISSSEQLKTHYLWGNLFENWVMIEYMKKQFNANNQLNLFFWRDKAGNEVDMILKRNNVLVPVEIKSGATINSDFFTNLDYFKGIKNSSPEQFLIYGGDENQKRGHIKIFSWKKMGELFD